MIRRSCDAEIVLDITVHPEQVQNNNVQFAVCLCEKKHDADQPLNLKTTSTTNDKVRQREVYSVGHSILH